jgi:Uma2 family endonuclease
MATTLDRPPAATKVVPDQRIVLRGVSWGTYRALLADFVDCQTPRFVFDRGTLEIVVTLSSGHEETKRTIEFLIDLVAGGLGIDVMRVGGMTFHRADIERGFEPDSCYYIQHLPEVRGREQIAPAIDPPPDLVIEIDVTRDSLPKLPLFAEFGIPEVWRHDGERVIIHVLQADGYQESAASQALPALTSETINRFLAEAQIQGSSEWMLSVLAWARQHRVPDQRLPSP